MYKLIDFCPVCGNEMWKDNFCLNCSMTIEQIEEYLYKIGNL